MYVFISLFATFAGSEEDSEEVKEPDQALEIESSDEEMDQ